ncbi:ligase-associated DNA damage response endonuclease PdeM [Dongia soli]|uniref:Ligase-associated DNA damage response endonuclease PdeM n=1 Tax=Dongia soli TaxID=600628 RepID=A0ABU5EBV5_9PROT|nr:ligase-associated DNA damage response endonuclease PdeM [Dongia soli]MDY0882948.1 ligase-associated DNA damage response endonuclease PdeM [Dongia soli]
MTHLSISFAGDDFVLDISGALYWPGQQCLVVADLHFEKGSAFAAQAYRPLPPHDTAQTLMQLHEVIARYQPRQVICLGDSFHDAAASDRLNGGDLMRFRLLMDGCSWIWVTGNHDPAIPAILGGEVVERLESGNVVLQHDASAESGLIFGHFHPVGLVSSNGHLIRRRCFVLGQERLLLPAFGSYAGGLNVLDPAIARLFPEGYQVVLLGHQRMHRLLPRQLRNDTSYAMSRRLPER